eukprot:GHVL01038499.1.p1 GENE.GHVL01038499.1~~GHVL01038499.1.p1  ORF type:complete len:247 (+),score=41.62 GHVL01038499.1:1163-1903(+)
MTLKRSYKFPVISPFNALHRVFQLNNTLIVESSIENVSGGPLFLMDAQLVDVEGNGTVIAKKSPLQDPLLMGTGISHMKIGEIYKLLFTVKYESNTDVVQFIQGLSHVANLHLSWSTPTGGCGGSKHFSIIIKQNTCPPIEIRLENCPQCVDAEEPFDMSVEVINHSNSDMSPLIAIDQTAKNDIVIMGSTIREIGTILPKEKKMLSLTAVGLCRGVCKLSGLHLLESHNSVPPKSTAILGYILVV